MKKSTFFFLFLLFLVRSSAQVTEVTEGNSIEQTLTTMFQNVNTAQAPTGILMNKAVYFANIHNYDGTIISDSTNVNINTLGWLYAMLNMAKVGTNTFPSATILYGENSYTMGGGDSLSYAMRTVQSF
jgi:hypothetical protein